jgi:hypothetical protein
MIFIRSLMTSKELNDHVDYLYKDALSLHEGIISEQEFKGGALFSESMKSLFKISNYEE